MPALGAFHNGLGQGGGGILIDRQFLVLPLGDELLGRASGRLFLSALSTDKHPVPREHERFARWTKHLLIADFVDKIAV
jgi:hypothetical protein